MASHGHGRENTEALDVGAVATFTPRASPLTSRLRWVGPRPNDLFEGLLFIFMEDF